MCFDGEKVSGEQLWRSKAMRRTSTGHVWLLDGRAVRQENEEKKGWKSSLDHIVDNLRMRLEMVTRSKCRLLKRELIFSEDPT